MTPLLRAVLSRLASIRTLAIACALCLPLVGASSVAAATVTDSTWSGDTAAGSGTSGWSNAPNWSTTSPSSAPSSGDTVATLDFPTLAGCSGNCYTSTDDFGALTVDQLEIDDGAPYSITGSTPITLEDGITAATADPTGSNSAEIDVPITLGGPQTWSITGNLHPPTYGYGDLILGGHVTGTADPVGVTLAYGGDLGLYGVDEVGPLTIAGSDPGDDNLAGAANGTVQIGTGASSTDLNSNDDNPVSVSHVGVLANDATTGPLSFAGGYLEIGDAGTTHQKVTVSGTVGFDANSTLELGLDGSGSTAGTAYAQLSASGAITLGGAALDLAVISPSCPALTLGTTDTLVTTTGSLTGTFAGLPDGSNIKLSCTGSNPEPVVRINYTASSVTATVVSEFDWSGGAAVGQPNWSNTANWAGGAAPTTTAGVLDFARLDGSSACAGPSFTATCYTANEDSSGLSVGALAITAEDGYAISGTNAITLGDGGVSTADESVSSDLGPSSFDPPITLAAPQPWSIGAGTLHLGGAVTGANDALAVAMSDGGVLSLSGDNEVGPVTITSDGSATALTLDGSFGSPVDLDSANAHAVSLSAGSTLNAAFAAVGALTVADSTVRIGSGSAVPAGSLSAASASFDAASTADFQIADSGGNTSGIDYGELQASGAVTAGGTLAIDAASTGPCPEPRPGTVYTLVSAAAVSGTFANAPGGADIADSCDSTVGYEINYNTAGSPQTVTATVVIAPTQGTSASLASLACTAAGNCVAVGSYTDGSGQAQAMVTAETDGGWGEAVEIVLPAGAAVSGQHAGLAAVACSTYGNCVAVGGYFDGSGNGQAMVVTETAGSWAQAIEIAAPTGASSDPNGELALLACTGPGDCIAAGGYSDGSANVQAMVVSENAGAWGAAGAVALPAGANSGTNLQYATLSSLACPSSGNCVAVGTYDAGASRQLDQQVMVATQSGGWTATAVALPAGAATYSGSAPGQYASLGQGALACDNGGHCVAAGHYLASANEAMVITGTTSGSWTASEITPLAGAEGTYLDALACTPDGTTCAAAGYQINGDAIVAAGTTTDPGSAWTTSVLSEPDSGGQLTALECTIDASCAGVGYYEDLHGNQQVMEATETSGAWGAASELVLPAGAAATAGDQRAALTALACPSAGNCVIAGSYDDGNSDQLSMVDSEASGGWNAALEITVGSPASTPAPVLVPVATPTATPTPTMAAAPAPAPPPPGVSGSTFGVPTTGVAHAGTTLTVTSTSGAGVKATVSVPPGALPAGTIVSVYPVVSRAALTADLPPGQSYVVSFAVSWQVPAGSSPIASAPVTITVTDPSIEAGETIYQLTANGLAVVGSATRNGVATITFTGDPVFVLASLTARRVSVGDHAAVTVIGYDKKAKSGARVTVELSRAHHRSTKTTVKVGARHRFTWKSSRLATGTYIVRCILDGKTLETTTITVASSKKPD